MPVEAESMEQEDEQVSEEKDEDREEFEAQEPVRKAEIPTPSKEEVRIHNTTHMPHRSWCPQCVAGRSKDDAHRERHEPQKDAVLKSALITVSSATTREESRQQS